MQVKRSVLVLVLASLPVAALAREAVDVPRPPIRPNADAPVHAARPETRLAEPFGPPMPGAEQVGAAAKDCTERLKSLGATFVVGDVPKVSPPECAVAGPVRLQRIAVNRRTGLDQVRLAGEPLLACETALAVTEWVQGSIAPLVRGHFDEPLLEIGVGGGFECRQRNHQSGAARSEHSYGRALDIMSFRTSTRMIKVEKAPTADVKLFLDAVWASGCGHFSTALGPQADDFHASHIHVDLQPRRSTASRHCE